MKYIDADKLIAKIERLRKDAWTAFQKGNSTEEQYYLRYGVIQDTISTIDSLQQEQHEMDLEAEVNRYLEEQMLIPTELWQKKNYQKFARHFYELGLKTRK